MKTEQQKGPTSKRDGTGINNRYQNDDLPDGCQDGNMWRRVFIPTVAHWSGGEVEPWGPDDDELRDVMQDIWDDIYEDKVKHTILRSGAVMKVVCPSLVPSCCSALLKPVGQATPHRMAWRVWHCSLLHPHSLFHPGP